MKQKAMNRKLAKRQHAHDTMRPRETKVRQRYDNHGFHRPGSPKA
jgi:hypothetical protein